MEAKGKSGLVISGEGEALVVLLVPDTVNMHSIRDLTEYFCFRARVIADFGPKI